MAELDDLDDLDDMESEEEEEEDDPETWFYICINVRKENPYGVYTWYMVYLYGVYLVYKEDDPDLFLIGFANHLRKENPF